ncbi:amino acid adenylation domain-containing protein [Kamptonema cortianum]|nr:amino acid adenylation domain-containing protein [Kamptonema cortianum]
MNSLEALLTRLSQLQVKIWVEGDKLRYSAPEGVLTAELKQQLRDRKLEAIARLQQSAPILPTPRNAALPLSFAQQRGWFLAQREGDSALSNLAVQLTIRGSLSVAGLERSLQAIIQRHEILRTTLPEREGIPVQEIAPSVPLTLHAIPASPDEVEQQIHQAVHQPFHLEAEVPFRLRLWQTGESEYLLLLVMHHLVSDGWSMGVLFRELNLLYAAFSQGQPPALPPLPIQYADYAVWQHQTLNATFLAPELAYWQQQLQGAPARLTLPADRPRQGVQTYRGTTEAVVLSSSLTAALKAFSQQMGATLFMTLLAAFKVLLYRYSGQTDLVVGTPVANRNRVELEGLIGFFINPLVLRTDLSGDPSFRELLGRVRQVTLGAYAHQNLPFEKLVEALQLPRDPGYSPLFQVMFVLQNAISVADIQLPGLEVSHARVDTETSQFDLTLDLIEERTEIRGKVEYNTDLFDRETIVRAIAHWQTLLTAIVADPDACISRLPLLTSSEQQQLQAWNPPPVTPVGCLLEQFTAQVAAKPDAVAIESGEGKLTYGELNAKTNQLARYLQQLGVKPDTLVGVCLGRSPLQMIAILAILKAGGAYVPLDPEYPTERLSLILSDAQISLVLTQTDIANTLPAENLHYLCLDTEESVIATQASDNLENRATASHLAYIIYTSGSTGKPKGVAIERQSLANYTEAAIAAYQIARGDRILQFASISFDAAAEEIFPTLLQGATLVLRTEEMLSSIPQFLQTCQAWQITVLDLPTAFWHQLVAELPALNLPDSLRLVIIGGEAALPEALATWHQYASPDIRLVNSYGPTEATIVTTLCDLSPSVTGVPIGKPVRNAQTYVLDAQLQPVPIGIPGELYIGGRGIARGYLNRPDLSAERFISNPFQPGTRFYRTGDRVRYRRDGNLEFLGRIDHQIKLRGFRIELTEIETTLRQHPQVDDAVVLVQSEQQQLIAYVVTPVQPAELRQFLSPLLPAYMVPSAFIPLDKLPLTPSGKVDRQALPAPDPQHFLGERSLIAPANPTEELLAGIWAEILQIPEISRDDNFFELGGHSLLATRVISQVRQVFSVEIALRTLFENPTLAQWAQVITQASQNHQDLPLIPTSRGESVPLSFAQQRLWFLAQLEPHSTAYNLCGAVRLDGVLNREALTQSFNEIVRRHESLRTTFHTVDGRPVATIAPQAPLAIPQIELSETEVQSYLEQEAQTPFDLTQSPLLRVKVLKLGEQSHILLLAMHHIASDGWSRGILVQELAVLYRAFCQNQHSPLPELPLQYADFAVWQRQWLQGEVLASQLAYWQQQLAGVSSLLALPTDFPRPVVQRYQGKVRVLSFSLELSRALKTLSQQTGSTLFMVLLAVFNLLLSRYTRSTDIVVGSPIANRNRAEIEGLIGFFVNTLVLRTDVSGNPTFRELLARVREVTLGAYAHQDLPFEQLVEVLKPERHLSHAPLFQVMFSLQNAANVQMEWPGLKQSPVELTSHHAKFDLNVSLEETPTGLVARFEYNTDLFQAATIDRMAGHLQQLCAEVVAQPDACLSTFSLLSPAEQHQLLVEWNNTQVDYPQLGCLHHWVEAQVEQTPDAVAVVFENHSLTYRQLNLKANQLAHHLQSLGVGVETLVGVCTERSLEMVIALLAILKAGAAYVPFDPTYPKARLAFMLQDSQVQVLLTQSHLIESLPQHPAQIVDLSSDFSTYSTDNLKTQVSPNNLAYVIYTSGSTGQPKGAMNLHRGVVNRLLWMQDTYSLTATDRILQKTPFSFDVSVWEFFWPLITGARLIIAQPGGHQDSHYLVNLIQSQQITTLHFVPSMLQVFLQEPGVENCQSLKRVICSGEALSWELQQRYFSKLNAQLHNLYGPTEAAIDVTYWECHPGSQLGKVPIGRPIANTEIYILDQHQQPVPIGVAGELHIGGMGLARGYLNRPELTAEKFISNPFKAGKLYKTGDLARYLETGEIEYLGRIDHQVKLRGLRIELGEIEATLLQHPEVQEAVVMLREDTPGYPRLVAYLVMDAGVSLNVTELRNFLMDKLPEYMIPSGWVSLAALPLSLNGKIDRRSLPLPPSVRPDSESEIILPRNQIESKLAQIWCKVLQVEQVSVQDNFFDLGGHSLLLIEVNSHIKAQFNLNLSIVELFRNPTLQMLAQCINSVNCQASNEPQASLSNEKIATQKTKQKQRLQKMKSLKNI